MKPRPNPLLRLSAAVALACIGSAHAVDISFSSGTPLTFTDTQSYDNGTVDRIGVGTGTVVNFDSGANYTFSGDLILTGAWNRITLNSGAALTVNGTLGMDVSGVSLNGGTLTTGALVLEDNPNWAGSLWDGKQWVEYGDSVINGSTIVANQSNANFIRMGTTSGFSVNWLQIGSDGATINSNGFNIGQTMNTWGNGGLTKTGSGTLSLTTSNNFSGNTVVSNGVLEVSSTGKLYGGGYTASPVITVASGGTLRLNGWSWDAAGSIANLDYSRDRLVVNGGTIEYTGNSNFNPGDPGSSSRNLTIGTGGATLKASSTSAQTWTITGGNGNLINNTGLTLDGAGAGEISNLIEGTGSVTKTGNGTWTLSGANTYNGNTIVKGGTLKINASTTIGSSNSITVGDTGSSGAVLDATTAGFTIGASQTLGGIGTILATGQTVTASGTVSAGNSVGTLTIDGGTLALDADTDFVFELGTSSDLISLVNSAALNLGSGTLGLADFLFSDSGGFGVGVYTLIGGASSFSGTLSGDLTGEVLGYNSTLSMSGNNLVLTVVPEPRAALLGGLGLLMLLRRRR
jgi:autotransporter-associated beta strand protein